MSALTPVKPCGRSDVPETIRRDRRSRGREVRLAAEAALLRRYARTRAPRLKEQLVRRFLPLARSLALRYRSYPEPLDDLIQVASLGLVKALDRFDPRRGDSFTAYAAPTILGELRRHFRDRVWGLRLPRNLQERTIMVREMAAALSEERGATPTVTQIAERLDLSEEEVLEAVEADAARHTLSLDGPQSDEEGPEPVIESMGRPDPGYGRAEDQLAAEGVPLTPRERAVLHLRFEHDWTQSEIGCRLGISQMQVSRIMRGALRKILEAVQGNELSDGQFST